MLNVIFKTYTTITNYPMLMMIVVYINYVMICVRTTHDIATTLTDGLLIQTPHVYIV